MESTDSASIPSLSGAQKAAIVLVALGPIRSAGILKLMRNDETDKLARAIAQLDRVTPEHVQSTLEEFGKHVTSQGLYVKGGLEYASKLLVETYGPSVAQPLIDRLANQSVMRRSTLRISGKQTRSNWRSSSRTSILKPLLSFCPTLIRRKLLP